MIELIKEEIINCNNTDHLCHKMILCYAKTHGMNTNDLWVHIVYSIKIEPIVFSISFVKKNIVIPKKSFKYYLLKTNINSFSELLYLVTLYPHFCFEEDSDWFSNKPNNSELISSYLSKSKGKLVYHYQLEQMYLSLKNSSVEDAIAFRKSINLKRKSAFQEAKLILLPNGESLMKSIEESSIKDFTVYPKIQDAMVLFNFLIKNKWRKIF